MSPVDEHARKTALYEQFARVGKALANPARLELLDLLAQGERSVEDLAETAQMKVSNTSAQLRMLAGAGLVASRRDGVRIFYRLADCASRVSSARCRASRRPGWPRSEQAARGYLGDVAALEPVAQDELSRRLRDGQVLVLDVRPEAEYAAGHIPGAVNVPHDQLAARLAEIPGGADIVAYCRGRYCVFAPDAVRLLRARGFSARPLEGGCPTGGWPGCPSPLASARDRPAGQAAVQRRSQDARMSPPRDPVVIDGGDRACIRAAAGTAGAHLRAARRER